MTRSKGTRDAKLKPTVRAISKPEIGGKPMSRTAGSVGSSGREIDESANRAATEKSGTSKQTNSGGTRRTASHQDEHTKAKQAKEASEELREPERGA